MDSKNTPIKAVRNAFTIVETIVEVGECSVTELAERLDMPKSTVYEYLRTLREEGYLINDDGTYSVSTRMLSIGTRARQNYPIYNVVKPKIRALAQDINEHASLMIEENGYGIILYTSPAEHTKTIIAHVGMRTYLHATAPGKAILAHLPPERRDELMVEGKLPAVTDQTITDLDALRADLETIRERGYSTDREEGMNGVRGIGAPIRNRNDGSVEGAISLYGPSTGDEVDTFANDLIENLRRTTNIVEVNLTYPQPGEGRAGDG